MKLLRFSLHIRENLIQNQYDIFKVLKVQKIVFVDTIRGNTMSL